MAGGNETSSLELLGKYRTADKKEADGALLPENETLNPVRVRDYLDKHGFNLGNFDQRFNVGTALEIVQGKATAGEGQMFDDITKAKNYLTTIGLPTLLEDNAEGSFKSTLNKELMTRKQLDKENELFSAWQAYQTIRKMGRNRYQIESKTGEDIKDVQVSTEKSIKDSLKGVLNDVKKGWRHMSGGEKLMGLGALILTTVAFVKYADENPTLKGIKDTLWKGIKVAGGVVGGVTAANFVYKLYAHKSIFTAFDDATKSSVGTDKFWTDTFHTTTEKAENMHKGMVYLGNKDFMDLAQRFVAARNDGSKKILLPSVPESDMKPDEIYAALETFFSKFDVDKLMDRYKSYKPPRDFKEVYSIELAEDGHLNIQDNLASRAVDDIKEYATRGWNWLLVGEGFGVSRYLYLKAFGKNGSDDEVKQYVEKLKAEKPVMDDASLDKWLSDTCGPKSSLFFKTAMKGSNVDTATGIKFEENPGDSLYMMSSVSYVAVGGDDKALSAALKTASEKTDTFLKGRFPEIAENIDKFKETPKVITVVSDGTLRMFVRMPLKNSPEYARKSLGVQVRPGGLTDLYRDQPAQREEKHGVEIFGPTDKIEYAKLFYWDQEKLRVRFLMDSTQPAQMEQICDWFTRKYNTSTLTKDQVSEKLYNDDKDRAEALQQLGLSAPGQQGLARLENFYKSAESDIIGIEKGAAKNIRNAGSVLEQEMEGLKRGTPAIPGGYKIRLALLGDNAAKAAVGYDPDRPDALKNLLASYKKWCKDFIDQRNAGKI